MGVIIVKVKLESSHEKRLEELKKIFNEKTNAKVFKRLLEIKL